MIQRSIVLSRACMARACRALSGAVQCFAARSAYWITMNPLIDAAQGSQGCTATFAIINESRKSKPSLCNSLRGVLQEDPSRRLIPARISNIRECRTAEFTCSATIRFIREYNIDVNNKHCTSLLYHCYIICYYCYYLRHHKAFLILLLFVVNLLLRTSSRVHPSINCSSVINYSSVCV